MARLRGKGRSSGGFIVACATEEQRQQAVARIGDKGYIQDESGRKQSNWAKFRRHEYTSYSTEAFRGQLRAFRDAAMTGEERAVVGLKELEAIVCAPYNLHQERLHEGRLQELSLNGLGLFKVDSGRARHLVYQRLLGQAGLSYDMEVMRERQRRMGFDSHPDVVADWLLDNREDMVGYIRGKVYGEATGGDPA